MYFVECVSAVHLVPRLQYLLEVFNFFFKNITSPPLWLGISPALYDCLNKGFILQPTVENLKRFWPLISVAGTKENGTVIRKVPVQDKGGTIWPF